LDESALVITEQSIRVRFGLNLQQHIDRMREQIHARINRFELLWREGVEACLDEAYCWY